jgi:argininosuccinate lyase
MSNIRGRFGKDADKKASKFTSSIAFDWRLYPYDIAGSIAHVKMLGKQDIITSDEADILVMGLTSIKEEIEQDKFEFKPELEDIHMNIEARLIETVGDIGRKLHTARSRNDQVALDIRLFTKDAINNTITGLRRFQRALISQADANQGAIMPGYTHLQRAQPVLLTHHLLAYFEMLQRDIGRFNDCLKRTDVLPLGSGALAGVSYKTDREFLAKELGFSQVSQNSMDAVSDRDFIIEYESAASICMMHLSRFAEEMVLWSSSEFGFVELDDAFTTGSSIMPQKKNPDITELVRGKTGRVYGKLIALLTTMKGLPLTYNSDMQEDKEGFFDTVDTLLASLEVLTGTVNTLLFKTGNMEKAVDQGYILATDLADYLVRKGETFRTAYDAVASLVNYAVKKEKSFQELSLNEYQNFSTAFEEDVYEITVDSALSARKNTGSTAPEMVAEALSKAKKICSFKNPSP